MTTHSSILAWRILWTDEPGDTVHGVIKSWTPLNTYTHIQFRKTQKIQGRKKKNSISCPETIFCIIYT